MDIHGIRVLENVVEHCDEIIEWLEKQDKWESAPLMNREGASSYSNLDVRSCDVMFLPIISFENPSIIYDMNKNVWQAMNQYAIDYMFSFENIEPVSVNRYKPGQDFKSHEDRAPKGSRILSAVLYLNDVEDGGETSFDFLNYLVQPKAGSLVLFPSFFLFRHTAHPPKVGNKYSAAYWGVE